MSEMGSSRHFDGLPMTPCFPLDTVALRCNGEAPEQERQAVEVAGLAVVQPYVAGRSDVFLASRDFRL